jgi:hypothetical protein
MHILRSIGIGIIWAIGGYLIGAVLTYFLILSFSSNQHDRSVEAAMTAAFAGGPCLAVIAFIVGLVRCLRAH